MERDKALNKLSEFFEDDTLHRVIDEGVEFAKLNTNYQVRNDIIQYDSPERQDLYNASLECFYGMVARDFQKVYDQKVKDNAQILYDNDVVFMPYFKYNPLTKQDLVDMVNWYNQPTEDEE